MNPVTLSASDETSLDALLAGLEETEKAPAGAPVETLPEAALEAALESIETTTPAPVVVEKPQKTKKESKGKTAQPKAPKEKKVAEPKAPEEPKTKKEAPVRKHYASKTERLNDKLGTSLGDYTVLEVSDATLEGNALKTKQDETLATLKGAGVKVQNRMTFMIEFAAGKTAKLNGVIVTAFKLLASEGKITVGENGNLHKALIKHPYSPTAARAMGGNTLLAMKLLKVVVPGEKGEYLPNPESLYRIKINSMLGLKA